MRTWILGVGIFIAEAISPEKEYSLILSVFIVTLFVIGFFMDVLEFKKKLL